MVIVIGATGFIGHYTTDYLRKQGVEVLATGRNKKNSKMLEEMGAKFVEFDMTKEEDIQKLPTENVEGVIILAGLLPANSKTDISKDENAADYFKINTIGVINILEYCRKNGIKKVISTCSYADVFNSWRAGYATKETEPRGYKFSGDHAVYVMSKNAATDVIEYYNQQHGLQGAIFRLPPVYGVGPHSVIYVNGKYYKSGIQTFIENAEEGKDIEIWGNPHLSRDIIYVKDVARAFYLALKSDKTKGLYNMTSGVPLDLEDQVKSIIEVFSKDKKSKIVYKPEKTNNTPSFLFDITKAKEDFGFVPEYRNYKDIMIDYKKELESGKWDELIESGRKEK